MPFKITRSIRLRAQPHITHTHTSTSTWSPISYTSPYQANGFAPYKTEISKCCSMGARWHLTAPKSTLCGCKISQKPKIVLLWVIFLFDLVYTSFLFLPRHLLLPSPHHTSLSYAPPPPPPIPWPTPGREHCLCTSYGDALHDVVQFEMAFAQMSGDKYCAARHHSLVSFHHMRNVSKPEIVLVPFTCFSSPAPFDVNVTYFMTRHRIESAFILECSNLYIIPFRLLVGILSLAFTKSIFSSHQITLW